MARLLGKAAQSGEAGALPGFSPDRLATTAGFFRDLILLPQLLRALSGESLEMLHAEIASYVSERVAFILAACKHGGVSGP